MPECCVLIGKPGINVSTKAAYENLRLDTIQKRPDIDGMIEAIRNQDLRSITERWRMYLSRELWKNIR